MSEKRFLFTPSSDVKDTEVKDVTPQEKPERRYSFLAYDDDEDTSVTEKTEETKIPVAEPVKAPATEEIKPVIEETPVVEKTRPVVEETPVVEKVRPVVEETPVVEKVRPVVEETPVVEKVRPVVEETPVVEKTRPVVEETPVVEKTRPVVEETPVVKATEPVEEKTPVTERTEGYRTPVFVTPSEEEIKGEQDIEEVVPSVAEETPAEEIPVSVIKEEPVSIVKEEPVTKTEEPVSVVKEEIPVSETEEEIPVAAAEEIPVVAKEETPVAVAEETPTVEEQQEERNPYQVHSFLTDEDVDKDKFARKRKEKRRKKLRTYQQRQNRLGYAFMSPWILGFIVFTLFPFVATIYLSFTNVKSTIHGYEIDFAGIDNYITAFVKNANFTPALVEYIQVIVPYTFIVVVISFIIAYLLNKIEKGKGVLRTIYFLPVIIMSGPVMNQLTAVDDAAMKAAEISGGTVASDYSNIFIMKIIESYSPQISTALGSIFDQLSLILWFTGIPIVLFINALQKINVSIYEAAKIDSANSWQIMWKITIPMLRSIGMIITIFTIIQLGMYDTINPVYQLIIDATGDTSGGLGFAATYAWIYSLIVLVLILIVFLLFREKKGKRGA